MFADHPSLSESEELVLNTMSTINNLSYYAIADSAVTKRQLEIAASECHHKSPGAAHCTSAAMAYEYIVRLYENVVCPCGVVLP